MKLIDAIEGYNKSIQVFAGKALTSEEVRAAYAKATTDEEKKSIVSANAMQICKEIFVKGKVNDGSIRNTFIKIFEANVPAIVQTIHYNADIVTKAIKTNQIERLGKEIFNRGSVSYYLIDTIKRFFAAYPDRIMKEAFGGAPAMPEPPVVKKEESKKAPAKKAS